MQRLDLVSGAGRGGAEREGGLGGKLCWLMRDGRSERDSEFERPMKQELGRACSGT